MSHMSQLALDTLPATYNLAILILFPREGVRRLFLPRCARSLALAPLGARPEPLAGSNLPGSTAASRELSVFGILHVLRSQNMQLGTVGGQKTAEYTPRNPQHAACGIPPLSDAASQ